MDKLEQIEKLARAGLVQKEICEFFNIHLGVFHKHETWVKAYHKGLDKRLKTIAGTVEHLAEVGFSQAQIAEHIGHTKRIFQRGRYRENYLRGHHRMKDRLRSEMFKICVEDKTSMPKVRMLEFVSKNVLGWSDRMTQVKELDYNAIYANLRKAAEKDPAIIDQFQEYILEGGDPNAFFNGITAEA